MPSYLALLRAVNVSGRNKVAMAELRRRLSTAGYHDVVTYLQSGNVAFRGASKPEAAMVRDLEHEIKRGFGLDITVLVRTKQQLGQVHARNPFVRRGVDLATLHVTFLAAVPSRAQVTALAAKAAGADEAAVRGREVYLRCPNGYGRTKLTNTFLEKQLGCEATTRNWKTVTALVDLAGT